MQPSMFDGLRTARNLVKYANAGIGYAEIERYLKAHTLI
jgi:hypothetical protein